MSEDSSAYRRDTVQLARDILEWSRRSTPILMVPRLAVTRLAEGLIGLDGDGERTVDQICDLLQVMVDLRDLLDELAQLPVWRVLARRRVVARARKVVEDAIGSGPDPGWAERILATIDRARASRR